MHKLVLESQPACTFPTCTAVCKLLCTVQVLGGDILAWALEEDTLEDKLSQVSYSGKVKITGNNVLHEIIDEAPQQTV